MKSTTLVLGLLLSKAAIVTAYDDFNSSLEARQLRLLADDDSVKDLNFRSLMLMQVRELERSLKKGNVRELERSLKNKGGRKGRGKRLLEAEDLE